MKDDLVRRKDVLALTHELDFKNVPGLEHYKHRCIDPDAVREMEGVEGTGVGQRVEETDDMLKKIDEKYSVLLRDAPAGNMQLPTAYAELIVAETNSLVAKNLAYIANDLHWLRETMAKEKEDERKPSGPKCLDCKYSDMIKYIDTDGVVHRGYEWCNRKRQGINFDDRPDCDYFKPKEKGW